MIKDIKELREKLNEVLDGYVEQEVVTDWPQDGDVYWTFGNSGSLDFTWKNDFFDLYNLKTGNFFKTRDEALYHLKMVNLAWDIKGYSFEPDWNNNYQRKYYADYSHALESIEIDYLIASEWSQTHFKTEQDAENAFKDVSDADFLYMMRKGLI